MKRRALAWLLIVAGMFISRGFGTEDIVHNIDQAEYAVAADGLSHGWLPGADLTGSTKTPGIAVLYRLFFDLFGRSMRAIHLGHTLIMILTGVVVSELCVALFGLAAAIPSALLFWMTANSFSLPPEIVALNVESPGTLFAVIALWLSWKWPRLRIALLLAGASVALASLFRQSLAVFLVPVFTAVLLPSGNRLARSLWTSLGFTGTWLPVIIVYAAAGALSLAWYSWVVYPALYSEDFAGWMVWEAFRLNGQEFASQEAIPLLMAVTGVVLLVRSRPSGREYFLFSVVIASAVTLALGSRFFGHYWIQVFPAVAILGVPAWLALARGNRLSKGILIAALIFGGALAASHYPTWRRWDPGAPPRGVSLYQLGSKAADLSVARFVEANTRPDETIVVWGYCPQIYYYAHRLPGVRDYLCHWITGYSPGAFDPRFEAAPRSYGHPRAEEFFVEDLAQRAPKYFVDVSLVPDYIFPFYHFPVNRYPRIAAALERDYIYDRTLDEVRVYRRKIIADRLPFSQPDSVDSTRLE